MSGSTSNFSSAISDPFDMANVDNYHQPGFLGVSPDVWRSLAGFGGNLAAAANARTNGGFLAYGGGLAGPLGAAISTSQQQGLQRGQALADIGYRGALAQSEQLKNAMAMMNLPLAQAQAQLNYRMMTDPQFRQQFMSGMGMGQQQPMGAPTAVSGDTPPGGSSYAQGIHSIEGSGQNPNWPAAAGGPLGPHQFTAETWKQFAGENPQLFTGKSPDEILAARTDPQLSATATDWYAAKNTPILKAAGVDPSPQNLAIAHTLGGAGAAGVLKFPDEASLPQAIQATQPDAASAILRENPQFARMTVGDLRQRYSKVGAPAPYQVAQAGNGPLPVPQGQQPGAAPQYTTEGGGSIALPKAVPVQQMLQQADDAEARANQLEQTRAYQERMIKMFPWMGPYIQPPIGDPAALRQQANTIRQNALAAQNQAAQPQNLRGPGSVNITSQGIIQSPLEYEMLGPDGRKYRITQNTVEDPNHPYTRPEGVPDWAPRGTSSIALADFSTGEHKGMDAASEDAFGEKARAQYASAVGTTRAMEDLDHQFDQLNSGGPSWYNTGEGADWRLAFGKAVNAASRASGGGDLFDPAKLASGEDIVKGAKLAGMQTLSTFFGGSREAASIVSSTQSAVPNIENTPQGGKLVLNGIREGSQWVQDQHAFMSQWFNDHHGNMVGADVAFNKQVPSQMYARRAISMIKPFQIQSDKELSRYLPGTFVQYKGNIVQIPNREGMPEMPEYLNGAMPWGVQKPQQQAQQ